MLTWLATFRLPRLQVEGATNRPTVLRVAGGMPSVWHCHCFSGAVVPSARLSCGGASQLKKPAPCAARGRGSLQSKKGPQPFERRSPFPVGMWCLTHTHVPPPANSRFDPVANTNEEREPPRGYPKSTAWSPTTGHMPVRAVGYRCGSFRPA